MRRLSIVFVYLFVQYPALAPRNHAVDKTQHFRRSCIKGAREWIKKEEENPTITNDEYDMALRPKAATSADNGRVLLANEGRAADRA
jgi:hypothetical protein